MSDATQADREAELARQADVIAAVAKAGAKELPKLGGVYVNDFSAAIRTTEVETVSKAELAPKKGK